MGFTASALNLDQFNIDPLRDLYTPESMMEFAESCEIESNAYYQELTEGVNGDNIFQKFWKYVLKLLDLIKRGFLKLIGWVKSLFKRKIKKSADNVAKEAGLTPKPVTTSTSAKPISPEPAAPTPEVSKPKPQETPSPQQQQSKGSDEPVVTVDKVAVPKNPNSTMDVEDHIVLLHKSLKVQYDNIEDGYIGFNIDKLQNELYSHGAVKGQIMTNRTSSTFVDILALFLLIENDDYRNKMIAASNALKEGKLDDQSINQLYDETHGTWVPEARINVNLKLYIKDLTAVVKLLNQLSSNISGIDPSVYNQGGKLNERARGIFNSFSLYLFGVQMAINAITAIISSVFMIDKEYVGTIKDINQLAKFTELMIKDSIPPKYIAYNCWLAMANQLDRAEAADEFKPIWGQTRLVIFPQEDRRVINKIALSGEGMRCNGTEKMISERFKRIGVTATELLAITYNITANKCVTTAERVGNGDGITGDERTKLITDVNSLCSNYNLRFRISDLHSANLGKRSNGRYCITDYGNFHITAT